MRFLRPGPDPDATDTDAERVARIDQETVEEFLGAFSAYAKCLGTRGVVAHAVYHATGGTGEVPFYTVHIQLAGPGQSLQAYLLLHEDSLDIVDDFLDEEYGMVLDRADADDLDCDIVFLPDAVHYSATIPLLADLELACSYAKIPVFASPTMSRALSYYAFAARALSDADEPALSRKLSTYALIADEPSGQAPPDEVILVGVLEDQLAGGDTQRQTIRTTMDAEDYDEFCAVLAWLCRTGGTTDFESLPHTHQSDEDLTKAFMALHQEELAHFDAMLESLPELVDRLMSPRDEEDGAPSALPKRIVH